MAENRETQVPPVTEDDLSQFNPTRCPVFLNTDNTRPAEVSNNTQNGGSPANTNRGKRHVGEALQILNVPRGTYAGGRGR